MTDPSTPSSSEPGTPPPAAPTPPAYTPATGDPHHAGGKRGLSIAGFVVGIASAVFFWLSWVAIIIGVVGLVLSLLARSREPGSPNWMKILGLVFSIVGIVLGAIVLILAIIALASLGTYNAP